MTEQETTMTADQAKFLAATLGQQLQTEWMTTYKVLSAIPEDKKDWKPEPTARTASADEPYLG